MLNPVRVLYVDDEPAMLEVCKSFLEINGDISVEIMDSPANALKDILNGRSHAVISDHQMPEMTGIELLKRIRAAGNTTPFILFTGKGREEVAMEALNNGADFYIQKGGDPSAQFAELASKVRYAVSYLHTEEALKESEQRFRSVFDNASDAMIICDLGGRILDVNEQACRLYGRTKDHLLGCDLAKDIDVHSAAPLTELLVHAMQNGGVRFDAQYNFDGRETCAEVNARVIPYGEGTAVLAVLRDITDRKEREEALRKNERKFRAIFEAAEVGITSVGEDGRLLDFNDRMVDLLGYSREELGRLTFEQFTHPEDVDISHRLMAEVRDGQRESYELEKRYVRKDGNIVWVRLFVNKVYLDDDAPPTVLVIVTEISKRKRAEEALNASRARLSLAMDMARLVDWEYDPSTDMLTFSDGFMSLYGNGVERELTDHLPLDRYFEEFVHPDDREVVISQIMAHSYDHAGPKVLRTEHRIIRKDGEVRHILVHSMAFKEGNGGRVKVIGANQDITDQKLREQELRNATQKLALLNSITRHDMNNQITLLAGNLLLLKGRTGDPSMLSRVENMEKAISALGSMLKFTKDYQGMGIASPEWQQVREILQDPLRFVELVGLEMDEGVQRLSLYADPMFPKVMYNLIENSIRHGGRPVTIRLHYEENEGGLRFFVEDDGVGVPEDEKVRIFEQGYGRGTGLGLFLSREILSITDITIAETGRPGAGARFELFVPKGRYRIDPPAAA